MTRAQLNDEERKGETILGRDSSYSTLWYVGLDSGGGFVQRGVCIEIKAALLKGKFYTETEETEIDLYL